MSWEARELGAAWDARLDAMVGGDPVAGFMQTSQWASFKRAEGFRTLRLGLFDAGELAGAATVYCYDGAGASFAVCPEGPSLPWADERGSREALRAAIAAVAPWSEPMGAVGLRIEPHLPPGRPRVLRNWTRGPVDLTPLHTLVVDLSGEEAAILAAMKPKARYNIRLAARHGVTVRQSADMRDLAPFYGLFRETSERDGFFAEPYGFFLNLGAALFPTGRARLFLAEWRGELLAAHLVVFCGRRATYLYGASSSRNRHVMPAYAAHWDAMREARRRGCGEYDLYGYDPYGIPGHLYEGISRFKGQFGGERRSWLGAYDLVFYDRLAAAMADRLSETDPVAG